MPKNVNSYIDLYVVYDGLFDENTAPDAEPPIRLTTYAEVKKLLRQRGSSHDEVEDSGYITEFVELIRHRVDAYYNVDGSLSLIVEDWYPHLSYSDAPENHDTGEWVDTNMESRMAIWLSSYPPTFLQHPDHGQHTNTPKEQ